MTLVRSHKDHSPKEEWVEPNTGKVRPLDQQKVEQVVEKLHVFQETHFKLKFPLMVGHANRKQSSTTSHVDIIEKTGRLKCKLKFPCNLCEGDHLTHQCLAITELGRVWSKTQEFPSPEQPIVSQQPNQPLVDLVVEPSQYLVHPPLLSESDPYVIEPMSCWSIPLSLQRMTFMKWLN